MNIFQYAFLLLLFFGCSGPQQKASTPQTFAEPHRPQIHFTPKTAWMNDPNGMVYHRGVYHLFYQFYPDSTVWGPMHWGHATSQDLVHWEHQPIALYPDSLGYIFSGSAVIDSSNTSGFGTIGKAPMVAIFTHHDPAGEKEGHTNFQYQSLAYSIDDGKTWTKYAGNPVLKNPGIKDFRDPKVTWHSETKRWIMTLATLDRVTFYSSPDLKSWTKESEFGKEAGAHGGVWECPDLFPLSVNGEEVWVLLVSINPGGPNGGSATQYFTGHFTGHQFTPSHTDTRWIDYGPDNYAGVTWSNTGDRKIFLGWMSNWQYAQVVPTVKWRSAMTVPRELHVEKKGDQYYVASLPVTELGALEGKKTVLQKIDAKDYDLSGNMNYHGGPCVIRLKAAQLKDFSLTFSNAKGEKVTAGFDKATNRFFLDRSASGKTSFEKGFAAKHSAPRILKDTTLDLTLIFDNSSIELFADGGLTVMTQLFFPDEIFSAIRLQAPTSFPIPSAELTPLASIYKAAIASQAKQQ